MLYLDSMPSIALGKNVGDIAKDTGANFQLITLRHTQATQKPFYGHKFWANAHRQVKEL